MTTNNSDDNTGLSGDISAPLVVLSETVDDNNPTAVQVDQNDDLTDNGILSFMSVERAAELYKRIHSQGVLETEWKFYGRRRPNELAQEIGDENNKSQNDETNTNVVDKNQDLPPTEFDFDESFSELHVEEAIINDSLQLKRRSEPGSERKTNLSDIMSDIIKETSQIQ